MVCTRPTGQRLPSRCGYLSWFGALLAGALAVSGCGGGHARYLSHMERGKRYLAEDNLEKAGIEFRNALQIQPKDAEALCLTADVAERRGNVSEAIGLYQAAVDSRPDDERARSSLGKALVFAGAARRALDVIGPGLLAHPDSADLLAVRAAASHQLKDDVDARADAERAVRLAPTNENAISVLAGLEAQSGDLPHAIALVSEAVRARPSAVDLRQVLASLYLSAGQPEQAEEQMRKLIELRPRDLSARIQLAAHYSRAHRPRDAQRVLADAVRDLPKSDQAKLTLVDFIVSQRSREQGEKTLRDFIVREPENMDLRFGLGALLQRSGDERDAITVYNQVIAREGTGPKGLMARNRIAAIRVAEGNNTQAEQLVAEVLRQSPRDNDALILRANLELGRHDPTAAIADLRAVLRDQPRSVALERTLARAYLATGDRGLAEEALRAALESAPKDVSVRVELGELLTESDRAAQAVTLLEETVPLDPSNPRVREVLIGAYRAKRDFAAARTAAEDLKTLRPDSAVGFYLAGLVAEDDHRLNDARKDLERALELQPGAADILAALARVEVAGGNPAAAVARVAGAVERDPKNVKLLDLLGGLYAQTQDFGRANEVLTRAIALAPADSRLVMELSSVLEKLGRIDEAIGRYDALLRGAAGVRQIAANNLAMLLVTYKTTDQASLDRARDLTAGFITSDSAALLDTHGWVRFKRREYQDALAVLERAAERAPDSKVIRYHLGMAELQLGKRERARTDLEAALSGTVSFSGSEEARSALESLRGRSG